MLDRSSVWYLRRLYSWIYTSTCIALQCTGCAYLRSKVPSSGSAQARIVHRQSRVRYHGVAHGRRGGQLPRHFGPSALRVHGVLHACLRDGA